MSLRGDRGYTEWLHCKQPLYTTLHLYTSHPYPLHRLKAAMVREGTMMISYQPLPGLPNFLRMVTVSPSSNEADMDFVLDEVERLGAGLEV